MLRKVIIFYRLYGFAALIKRFLRPLRRIGRNLFYRKSFYVYYWDTGCISPPASYDDIEFIEVDRTMIGMIAPQLADHYGRNAEQAIGDRIDSGDIAVAGFGPVLGAFRELMFFCWISPHDELLIAFIKRVCYPGSYCIKRLFVPEKFRRRSIAVRGHAFLYHIASNHGIRRLWSFVDKANIAAYHLHTDALKDMSMFWGEYRLNSFCGLRCGSVYRSDSTT